ncbi:hypothetical protein FGW37_12050 [Streptomyces rectiverticillatus]|uniref:hypothetical protein n=1 Tax=Streptomyces rectiverticillatus TaxID=173860 RepID=UPI0015C38F3B|nr:hypothetical protein [Streptomyces rectiverticillatus]QLE72233.1 hypothetical protein FGW37_12050 [Streptomyces rectiverticillatus]
MPRPTPAQITYGSATVVFSTLAMLLLSQTSSGFGIAVIAVAALALGLFVAVAFPMPRVGGRKPRVPRQRTPLPAEPRLGEHSLHG